MQATNTIPIERPTRVITVRLTESMHAALRREAHRREKSLNAMCVESLASLLPIDAEFRTEPVGPGRGV